MTAREDRARLRRETWSGGVAESHEELGRIDGEQWKQLSGAQRLAVVWSLVVDGMTLQGNDGSSLRLQRSVGGIRPLRS